MPTLLPPDGDLELLHTRSYEVKVYLADDDELIVRGAVHDEKPPGMYVTDDPAPLTIHHMVVEWRVTLDGLRITDASVLFEDYPNTTCPAIAEHYENLVGLEITRGFTHKVRELFGGPRGCTHTTALLQAMAPAVVQSMWSVYVRRRRLAGEPGGAESSDDRQRQFAGNLNTCHVWHEDGEQVARIRGGATPEPPLQIRRRLTALGRDPAEWASR